MNAVREVMLLRAVKLYPIKVLGDEKFEVDANYIWNWVLVDYYICAPGGVRRSISFTS